MTDTLDQIFNAFCRVVEHEINDRPLWNALRRAPLCQFDTRLTDANVLASLEMREMDLYLPPMMPFDEVVLVDHCGVAFFYDARDYNPGEKQVKSTRDGDPLQQRLVDVLREVKVAMFTWQSDTAAERKLAENNWGLLHGEVCMAVDDGAMGKQRRLLIKRVTGLVGRKDKEMSLTGSREINVNDPAANRALDSFSHLVSIGFNQLYYIDLPRHHVIVEHPATLQGRIDGPKLLRAHDRDKLRLIDPEKIHEVYPRELSEADGTTKVTPHMRRGHTKYLTSPKFTKKQWTRIRIRPTWVGEPEWQAGNLKYRVLVRGNDSQSS